MYKILVDFPFIGFLTDSDAEDGGGPQARQSR